MELILQNGIALIVALQALGDWLIVPMRFFSFLGSQEFLLLMLPVVYWSINASLGARIGAILLITGGLNDVFKLVFHGPRPYWFSAEVKAYAFEPSFGAPSGHSQVSVGIWGLMAAYIKRPWGWAAAIGIIFMVGLSRMYLGVHFPHDVLLGWLMGSLVLWIFLRYMDVLLTRLKSQPLGVQIGLAFGLSTLMLLASSAAFFSLQGWVLPAAWAENALRAGSPTAPAPLNLHTTVTSAGVMFGLLAGLAWTHSRGGFSAAGPVKKRVARYLLGLVILFLLAYGLGAIFPDGDSLLAYFLRYVRYALVGGWITAGAPFVFLRLNLAEKNSPSGTHSA